MASNISPEAQAAWLAYVDEVKRASEPRNVDYIKSVAQKWSSKGRGTFVCLSPLRSEKTPSFYVYQGKGWHDYGTQEGGDLLKFVLELKKCSFRQAVDELAKFSGVATWDERKGGFGGGAAAMTEDELLKIWNDDGKTRKTFECLTWLAMMANRMLDEHPARDQLLGHYGLESEYVDLNRLGFCNAGFWEWIHECDCPYDDETLLSTGFFIRTGHGIVPTFSDRLVMFYWKNGVARYAIGRQWFPPGWRMRREDEEPAFGLVTVPEWDKGKYKKLPTFDEEKRPYVSKAIANDVLWGIDSVARARNQTLVITEGVTDAMMLDQLGFPVISPVTVRYRNADVENVRALLKQSGIAKLVILNDADTTPDGKHPGLEGAKTMAADLWSVGIQVHVGRLPKPDGVAKIDVNEIGAAAMKVSYEHAQEVLREIIESALPYPEFLIGELHNEMSTEELDVHVRDLGKLFFDKTPLAQDAILDRIRRQVPKLPKTPTRRTFNSGVIEAKGIASEKAKKESAAQAAAVAPKKSRIEYDGKRMRGAVSEELGYYERISPVGDTERISTFSLIVIQRAVPAAGGQDWIVCRAFGIDGEVYADRWAIPPKAWTSKRAFISAFPNHQMVWTGSDDDVQGVLELVSRDAKKVPRVTVTDVMGRHESRDGQLRFVLPAGTIGAEGWIADPDVALLVEGGGANLVSRLPKTQNDLRDPATHALAKRFLETAPHLHDPDSVAASIGWWCASLLREPISDAWGAFPILAVSASPGAGKTSLFSRIFWPAFAGVVRDSPLGCVSTTFALAKDFSSSNSIALLFDEYKPADMGPRGVETFVRLLRRAYTGETEARGRADQGVNILPLHAPCVLMGESRFEGDQALAERCAYVSLPRGYTEKRPEVAKAFHALTRTPLHMLAPLFAHASIRVDVAALMAGGEAAADEALNRLGRNDIPTRVRLTVNVLCVGMQFFAHLCERFGATNVYDAARVDAMIVRLLAEMFDEEPGALRVAGAPASRMRDNFDSFLETCATAASLGILKEGEHYAGIDGDIVLYVDGIVPALEAWHRSRGTNMPYAGAWALKKLAREKKVAEGDSSYIANAHARIKLDPHASDAVRRYVVRIRPKAVPPNIESIFPIRRGRSWGGGRLPGMEDEDVEDD